MTYIPKLCNMCGKVILEKSVHLCRKLLEDKQLVLARKCSPVVASRYGFTSRLLVLPNLETHTTGTDGLLQLPHTVALHTMMLLLAMVLTVSIQDQIPNEDIYDAKEQMEFIHHNVVQGNLQKRR